MFKFSRCFEKCVRSTSACVALASLIGAGAAALSTPALADATQSVIYSFAGGADGAQPQTSMTQGPDGDFYGTTTLGGAYGVGTVFQLSPDGKGGWIHKVIFSPNGFKDGGQPYGQLTFDSQGNLYGTCISDGLEGNGAVFQLVRNGKGDWKLGRHYRFKVHEGRDIDAGVVVDSQGNVFGTAHLGGKGNVGYGYGTLYELSPGPGDTFVPTFLYQFHAKDGGFTSAGLIMGKDGDLFGVSPNGGASHQGYAFKLHKDEQGVWRVLDIHDFNITIDGEWPDSTMIMDADGNLYGGTSYSPAIVYKLSPPAKGSGEKAQWTETTLYQFAPGVGGGGLSFDLAGNLLAASGGGTNNAGFIFQLSPTQSGPWIETVLYNFLGGAGGSFPLTPLILQNGLLYGTTTYGGASSNGTIFSLTH
jgi:uncharacterized repeat protein (TIGR03803 family)